MEHSGAITIFGIISVFIAAFIFLCFGNIFGFII